MNTAISLSPAGFCRTAGTLGRSYQTVFFRVRVRVKDNRSGSETKFTRGGPSSTDVILDTKLSNPPPLSPTAYDRAMMACLSENGCKIGIPITEDHSNEVLILRKSSNEKTYVEQPREPLGPVVLITMGRVVANLQHRGPTLICRKTDRKLEERERKPYYSYDNFEAYNITVVGLDREMTEAFLIMGKTDRKLEERKRRKKEAYTITMEGSSKAYYTIDHLVIKMIEAFEAREAEAFPIRLLLYKTDEELERKRRNKQTHTMTMEGRSKAYTTGKKENVKACEIAMKEEMDHLVREKQFLCSKIQVYRKRELEYKGVIKKQTEKLMELCEMSIKLKHKAEEDDRMLELQSNDLIELKICLYELSLLQSKDRMPVKEELEGSSKAFWVLRKHQKNLVMVTRPHIKAIISASSENGIVSENIGKCATNCSIPHHDCVNSFYKALLITVKDSPCILNKFLQLILQQNISKSCNCLLSQIAAEVNG